MQKQAHEYDYYTHPPASPVMLDPWRRLAAAILVEAAHDARSGQVEALDWLAAGEGDEYADAINLDPGFVSRWAFERLATCQAGRLKPVSRDWIKELV
jgi:hypothetical protein